MLLYVYSSDTTSSIPSTADCTLLLKDFETVESVDQIYIPDNVSSSARFPIANIHPDKDFVPRVNLSDGKVNFPCAL